MMLSVVVPTLNEASSVAACVEAAFALRAGWGGEIEVVVVDGGSGDDTYSLAAAAGARVVRSEPGRGQQLRAGVLSSAGDVVLMLHADTRLAPAAGAQLARALDDQGIACGAFRQQIDSSGVLYRLLERGNAWRAGRLGLPYGDQGIFARKDLLEQIGGVPALPLMEDVALMLRLRSIAWPVLLEGPLNVSARRWQKSGVVQQTLKNWALLAAYRFGVSPERLASWYRS